MSGPTLLVTRVPVACFRAQKPPHAALTMSHSRWEDRRKKIGERFIFPLSSRICSSQEHCDRKKKASGEMEIKCAIPGTRYVFFAK